jgi:hypothetical protein
MRCVRWSMLLLFLSIVCGIGCMGSDDAKPEKVPLPPKLVPKQLNRTFALPPPSRVPRSQ